MLIYDHPYLFFITIIITIISITIVFILWIICNIITRDFNPLKGNIGIIRIDGIIRESDNIIQQLKKFEKARNIKAIIIRIDSPGGSVGPSQEIYSQILKISSKKTVISSMASIAASGGYYIASASNHIMSNPGTLTGSLGVIMSFTNIKELIDKIGLKKTIIKSGNYKDIGSSFREMTNDEQVLLQNLSDDIHEQFINDIAKGRKMEKSEVKKFADGRIFTGKQAFEFGFVDALGNLDEAIECAAKMGKVKGEAKPVYSKKRNNFLKEILMAYY